MKQLFFYSLIFLCLEIHAQLKEGTAEQPDKLSYRYEFTFTGEVQGEFDSIFRATLIVEGAVTDYKKAYIQNQGKALQTYSITQDAKTSRAFSRNGRVCIDLGLIHSGEKLPEVIFENDKGKKVPVGESPVVDDNSQKE